jgi:hypothetical protein
LQRTDDNLGNCWFSHFGFGLCSFDLL